MKTNEQVDEIMLRIPKKWRKHWCEARLCACLGCVQTGNKAVMAEETTGTAYRGDPEYIDPDKIPEEIRDRFQLTRNEWERWKSRQSERWNR